MKSNRSGPDPLANVPAELPEAPLEATQPARQGEPEAEPSPARPRRRLWIVGVVILALVVIAILARTGRSSEEKKAAAAKARGQAAIPVVVAEAQTADFPVYLSGLGTITPLATVTVRSRVDGELIRVAFKEGQLVKQDELLAEIDPRPFQVQLTQAEGQLAKDQANLVSVKLDYERFKKLLADGLIPQSQFDAQASLAAQVEASIKSDEGTVAGARLNLTYSKITAPITGRAGLRQVDPGNMVHAADSGGIVVLTQLDPIATLFTLPEDSLQAVLKKLSGGATLPVEAWDRDLKTKLEDGKLLTVDNQIDPSTGTVRLKAVFDNRNGLAIPESVRQRPAADRHAAPRRGRALRGHPAHDAGRRRLRGGGRRHGLDAPRRGRAAERRPRRRHEGRRGGRAGRHRRRRQAAERLEGDDAEGRRAPAPGEGLVSPSRPFILRPVATSLLMVGLLLAGLVAYRQLPVSALPQVDYPTIQVVTFYPGASPDVMASSRDRAARTTVRTGAGAEPDDVDQVRRRVRSSRCSSRWT